MTLVNIITKQHKTRSRQIVHSISALSEILDYSFTLSVLYMDG